MCSFKEEVARRGYVFVREFHLETDTVSIVNAIGQSMTSWKGRLIQELVPRRTATPNTYSGIYGLEGFPFHTDLAHWRLPPRYLLLRCVVGYANVPTLLLDSQAIFEGISLDILARALFRPRRPRNNKFPLLRLYEPTQSSYCFRWDEMFLRPASRIGEIADQGIKDQLRKCVPISLALEQIGDILLVDNWRMLHARSPISAEYMDRKIQRVYLEDLH